MDRRTILKSIGSGSVVGLAGCSNPLGNGGSDSGTIKIGLVAPRSGSFGRHGDDFEKGIRNRIAEIEDDDDVLPNAEFEIVTADTEADPETGLSGARELVTREEVDHLFGPVNSAVANSIRNFVGGRDVTLAFVAGGSFLTAGEDCVPNVFRCINDVSIALPAGVDWTLDELGEEVYVLWPDYSFGRDVFNFIQSLTDSLDFEIVGDSSKSLGSTEFGDVIQDIKSADPDWVSMNMSGGEGVQFYADAASRGLDVPCAGVQPGSEAMGELTVEQFEALPDIYYDSEYWSADFDGQVSQDFLARHNDMFDSRASSQTASGYSWAKVMTEVQHEAGGVDASTDDFIAGLKNFESETAYGDTKFRECDHQAVHPMKPTKLSDVSSEVAEWEIQEVVDAEPYWTPCEDIACQL